MDVPDGGAVWHGGFYFGAGSKGGARPYYILVTNSAINKVSAGSGMPLGIGATVQLSVAWLGEGIHWQAGRWGMKRTGTARQSRPDRQERTGVGTGMWEWSILHHGEEKYRLLADNVSDILCIVDMDLRVRYVSPSVERVLGYTVEEAMQSTMETSLTPASRQAAAEAFEEDRRGADRLTSRTLELEVYRKGGGTVWMEMNVSFVRDLRGYPVAMLGIARDIDRRKRAEETLREGEAWFRGVYQQSPIGIQLYDHDGRLIGVNRATLDIFGVPGAGLAKRCNLFDLAIMPAEAKARLRRGEIVRWQGAYDFAKDREPGLYTTTKSGTIHLDVLLAPLCAAKEGPVTGYVAQIQDITEQKRAEDALCKSESRYRLLAENVTDVIWTTDLDLRPTYLSPSFTRLTGYTVEEGMSRTIDEGLTPASREAAKRTFDRELAREKEGRGRPFGSLAAELEFNRKDGSTVWVEAEVTFLRDPASGMPVGLLGVSRDISRRRRAEEELRQYKEYLEEEVSKRTAELMRSNQQLRMEVEERKRTEEALRESEKRYRLLAENVSDVIFTTDLDLRPLYLSPSIARLRGYTAEEVRQQSAEEIFAPASLEVAEQVRREELALEHSGQAEKDRARIVELELKHRDGSTVWVESTVQLLRDEAGQPVGFMGVLRDITKRKQAEEALRESELKYSAVVEQARDGVFILQDGVCQFANKAMAEITGYSVEEMLSMPFLDIASPESRGQLARMYRLRKAGRQALPNYETTLLRKGGATRVVEVSTGVIQYRGRPAHVGIVRDITERKEAEDKLREAYEREAKLRRDLEEEIRKRGEFLRTLVHELKTPLTAILASSSALAAGVEQSMVADFAGNIERGASRLNRRISELIDLARGDIGMLYLNREMLDPVSMLEEIANDMEQVAKSRDLSLVLDVPGELPAVYADAERLRQVVVNLLDNAFKFTPPGGVVTVSAEEKDDCLHVSVMDTGPGIPAERRERLFDLQEPMQVEGQPQGGLGIGLALSKRLVELHRGRIWVEAGEGRGSIFRFSVPLDRAAKETI